MGERCGRLAGGAAGRSLTAHSQAQYGQRSWPIMPNMREEVCLCVWCVICHIQNHKSLATLWVTGLRLSQVTSSVIFYKLGYWSHSGSQVTRCVRDHELRRHTFLFFGRNEVTCTCQPPPPQSLGLISNIPKPISAIMTELYWCRGGCPSEKWWAIWDCNKEEQLGNWSRTVDRWPHIPVPWYGMLIYQRRR